MDNVIEMKQSPRSIKIVVSIEPRSDGGLRAWSKDLPGFVLSHKDSDQLLDDVPHVIAGILSHQLCSSVDVELLADLSSFDEPEVDPDLHHGTGPGLHEKEYVARCA